MHTNRAPFLQNQGPFFLFWKKSRVDDPPAGCAPASLIRVKVHLFGRIDYFECRTNIFWKLFDAYIMEI